MAKLVGPGLLVAGDAAGFCVNTGIVLQGINLALLSGKCAGQAALEACRAKNFDEATLAGEWGVCL